MGRYSKIILGPARKNDPQVVEAEASVAIMPGTFVVLSSGKFALAGATTTDRMFLAQENYLALKGVDIAYKAPVVGPPAVPGDRVVGLTIEDDVHYAARLANGVSVTVGQPLAVGANGNLVASTTGARIVAFAAETFNNNTGAAALLQIRPAGSQSRQA